uniref:Sushi domain-containing protein n=1 Tax=Accipiter nisus TaxID=211598 RepID=A0A8B9MZJ3_9AVES
AEVRCPVPVITHGQLKPAQNFTYGSTATLECDAGYIPVGATTIVRCLSSGRWHPRMPACILEVRCPNPTIHHGREISPRKAEYTFGNQVELQCDPGYVLRGSQRIQCWSDGTWRPPVPYCDKGECERREQGGCQEFSGLRKLFPCGNRRFWFSYTDGRQAVRKSGSAPPDLAAPCPWARAAAKPASPISALSPQWFGAPSPRSSGEG